MADKSKDTGEFSEKEAQERFRSCPTHWPQHDKQAAKGKAEMKKAPKKPNRNERKPNEHHAIF
jgi:hypothetical protein